MQGTEFDIEALPVKIDYAGETMRDNNWKCDQWRVQLSNKKEYWTTYYFTGLGLRAKNYSGLGRKWDGMCKKHYDDKPIKPTVAAVLHSLFTDAKASEYNFFDWCDEYGYSSDSISAMNTYNQCLETAASLRKYFSIEQREAIKVIIQDL